MTPALPDRPPLPTYNDVRGSFNKYRSIAYGTWKPGEAKRFSEKSKRKNLENIASTAAATASQKSHSESAQLPRRDLPSASSESLDCPTLVPTEDEMSEIENCKTEPILFTHHLQPQHQQQHRFQHQKSHQCAQTTPSLTKRRNNNNNNILNNSTSTMTVSFEPDCYSSQDYINYCITRNSHHSHYNNSGYSTSTLPLASQIGMNRSMDALNDRLIHSTPPVDFTRSLRRQKPSTSSAKLIDPFNFGAPQMHKRTRSFDGATHFAVISPSSKGGKLSTYGQKSITALNSSSQKTGAFQATKNFIKKLYNNSTTLPKKLRSGKSSQKLDRIKAATSPFYEMRYPEPEEIPYLPYNIQYEVESDAGNDVGDEDESEETEMDIGNEEFDSSVAPSCSSSTSTTAEKSINGGQNTHDEGIFSGSDEKSQTGSDFTAPSCISSSNRSTIITSTTAPAAAAPAHTEQFQSWNDLFGHLKKEITEMRARDAQILENLKTVESQLSYVKGMDRSKSEYSPLSRMLNAPTTIPAGSREPKSSTSNNNRPPLRSTFI
jgi:hypothetical protein